MAHSHRPQINAARAYGDRYGEGSALQIGLASERRSQRDGGNTTLKTRSIVALAPSDQLQDLLERENASKAGDKIQTLKNITQQERLLSAPGEDYVDPFEGAEIVKDRSVEEEEKQLADYDDKDDEISSASEYGSDSDDDGSDDEEELAKELQRIRQEREEERQRETARREEEVADATAVSSSTSEAQFGMKRRWDSDVVFHNQARTEPKKTKRFINDTIRNDFHRSFIKKYIR